MLKKLLLKIFKGIYISVIQDDEFRNHLYDELNKKISIPVLNEEQERNVIKTVVESVEDTIVDYINKK